MNRLYIFLAILLGLSVVAYFFLRDVSAETLTQIELTPRIAAGIALAAVFFVAQNFFYTLRYKLLMGKDLKWSQAFRTNVLCEFTSAVTPTVVGGSSLIFVYLHREGFSLSRSTTTMISSLFLDELFIGITSALIVCVVPMQVLFGTTAVVSFGVKLSYLVMVAAIILWTAVLYTALFVKPQIISKVALLIVKIPGLRRFKTGAEHFSEEIKMASAETRHRGWRFWLRPLGSTCGAWFCRYAVAAALLLGFTPLSDLPLAYARQWILWIVTMISPTPGGSGMSEWMFKEFYSDFLPSTAATMVVAMAWRIITYYTYLIGGAIVVPAWIGKKEEQKRK